MKKPLAAATASSTPLAAPSCPVSAATSSIASTTAYKCSSGTGGPLSAVFVQPADLRAAACRAGSCPSAGPIPADSTPARRPSDPAPSGINSHSYSRPEQRIVHLVRHVSRPAVAVGHGQRLHQVPSGKIRAARCSAPCPRGQTRSASPALPQSASSRRSHAGGRCRCIRCPAGAGCPRCARRRWYRDEPTSFGPVAHPEIAVLVEISAWSRLPASALPRISSERPLEYPSAVSNRLTPASKQMIDQCAALRQLRRRAPTL